MGLRQIGMADLQDDAVAPSSIPHIEGLNREIVALLQEDGRMPFSSIARTLGVSEGTVRSRVGPIFIPWLMVPQLSFLFWGWFKTVLQYSFYGAVAAAVFRMTAEVGAATLNTIAQAPILTTPTGLGNLIDILGTCLMFAVASFLASLKIGEFVQLLMSGAGSLSSGLGTRLMQASRLGR